MLTDRGWQAVSWCGFSGRRPGACAWEAGTAEVGLLAFGVAGAASAAAVGQAGLAGHRIRLLDRALDDLPAISEHQRR
jgi:hypothetical protein